MAIDILDDGGPWDDDLRGVVLNAVYGLAKGRAGVPVAVAAVATQTGLDAADVRRAVAALARDGRIVGAATDAAGGGDVVALSLRRHEASHVGFLLIGLDSSKRS
jgi:hypothetical protein